MVGGFRKGSVIADEAEQSHRRGRGPSERCGDRAGLGSRGRAANRSSHEKQQPEDVISGQFGPLM